MDTDNIIEFVQKKHGHRYRLDADDPVFMAATIVEGVVGEAQKKTLGEISKLLSGFADQIATASVLAENMAKAKAETTVTAAAQWAAEQLKAAGVDAGKLAAGPVEAALEKAERAARTATIAAWVGCVCAVASAAVALAVVLR
jgi:hypothetical protein